MDCSTPGFTVFNYMPEFAQSHVHLVSDAIQPSHPLSSACPLSKNYLKVIQENDISVLIGPKFATLQAREDKVTCLAQSIGSDFYVTG